MEAIRGPGVRIGIDPLGGAAVHYWQPIIERYGLAATIVSDAVDPTFRFMTVDWDGKIRMDCSSPYAMARLIGLRDKFDVAFANDTDADRHGIVTRSKRADEPQPLPCRRHRLSVRAPPALAQDSAIGKTIVSSAIIDRVAAKLGRKLVETPVGFKWFVDGLCDGVVRFRGRGKRRRLVPPARRIGMDHRQGRHHSGIAGRRDDRAHQIRPQPVVRPTDERIGRAFLRTDRCAGELEPEEPVEGALG